MTDLCCPRCRFTFRMAEAELVSDDPERAVLLTCDHCGATRRAGAFRRAERRRQRREARRLRWRARGAAILAGVKLRRDAVVDKAVRLEIAWRAANRTRIAALQQQQADLTAGLNTLLSALRQIQEARPGSPNTIACPSCKASVIPQLDAHAERRCPLCRSNYDLGLRQTRDRLTIAAKELTRREREGRGRLGMIGRRIGGGAILVALPVSGLAALYHGLVTESTRMLSWDYVVSSAPGRIGLLGLALLAGGIIADRALGLIDGEAVRRVDAREDLPAKPAKPITRPPTIWEAQEEQRIRLAQPPRDEAGEGA